MNIKELRKICQYHKGQSLAKRQKRTKDKILITWIDVILRLFSIYATWLIIQINNKIGNKIRAHHVAFSMIIINSAACVLLATGIIKFMLLGCLLLILGALVDNFDGEVARYYKDITLLGKQIDNLNHKITSRLFYFAIAFAVYLNTGFIYVIPLGFLGAVLASSVVSEAMTDTLVQGRLWEIQSKNKFNQVTDKKLEKLGAYHSGFVNKILRYARYLYIDAYDKVIYIALILIGVFTGKTFQILLIAITFYSLSFIALQAASVIYMLKGGDINKYYNTLFNNKK